MIGGFVVLIKIFLIMEFAISSIVVFFFVFFEGVSYLSEGGFFFDNLWKGLKGATFGAISASLVLWFFYFLVPELKK